MKGNFSHFLIENLVITLKAQFKHISLFSHHIQDLTLLYTIYRHHVLKGKSYLVFTVMNVYCLSFTTFGIYTKEHVKYLYLILDYMTCLVPITNNYTII